VYCVWQVVKNLTIISNKPALWHKITNEINTVIRQHTIHPVPNIHNLRVNDYWITIYCIKVWLTVLRLLCLSWFLCLLWLRSVFEVEPVLLVLPIACRTIRTFRKVRNIVIWISRMAEFDTMVCIFPANADQVALTCTSNFNALFWKTLFTGCRNQPCWLPVRFVWNLHF